MTKLDPYGDRANTFKGRPVTSRNLGSYSDTAITADPISSDDERSTNKANIKHTDFISKRTGMNTKTNVKDADSRSRGETQAIKAPRQRIALDKGKGIDAELSYPKRRVPDDNTKPLRTVGPKMLMQIGVKRTGEDGLGDHHNAFSQAKKNKRQPTYGRSSQTFKGNSSQANILKQTSSSPDKVFKKSVANSIERSPARKVFKAVPKVFFSSPTKSARTPKFKKPESPTKPFKFTAALDRKSVGIRGNWYKKLNVPEPNADSSSPSNSGASDQIPIFKNVDIGISMDDLFDDPFGDPVQVSSSPDSINDAGLEILFAGPSDEATCPMCKEIVSRIFLESYDNGRMNIRSQAAFCKAHKKQTATKDWKSRGYPDIDWTALASRIIAHRGFLLTLLSEIPSHYKDILSDTVKSGESRTLKQDFNSGFGSQVSAGYFGPRGQRMFSEWIMHAFAPQLRRRAIDDPLVSARGVTGFVQAVMVPELVCKLIEDDLNVDEDQARDVIEDSWELGELLCEEVDDVVERGEYAEERRSSVEYVDD